jgi:aspartyl-tRNA(Asn)/glutamyl-tRNA(Gln) amidotransferase subunit A
VSHEAATCYTSLWEDAMPDSELWTLTLEELSAVLREGQLSPIDVTQAYLARIDALDGPINAFITVTADQALAAARRCEEEIARGAYRGPLHGVPVALKDLYDTAGIPTTGGSKIYAHRVPDEDSTVAARLRAAGAVLVGKTNLHEFAYGVTTDSSYFGPTHNPWDLNRIAGGSSGGSGAALAASLCLAATGSDTGGSIRIPAALCGVVGLKPTYGRVSCHGLLPLSWSLDHAGPIARTVYGAAAMLEAMAGGDHRDPAAVGMSTPSYTAQLRDGIAGLRVGVDHDWALTGVQEDVRAAFQKALACLQDLGAEIVEVSVPRVEEAMEAALTILSAEAAAVHEEFLRTRAGDYQPDVRARLERGLPIRGTDYARARRTGELVRRDLARLFEQVDLLATPMCAIPAPRLGQQDIAINAEVTSVMAPLTQYTRIFNLTGLPAISAPCGFSAEGLPIGLQLVGRAWEEATVLRAAHAYEAATPWSQRRPPLQRGRSDQKGDH